MSFAFHWLGRVIAVALVLAALATAAGVQAGMAASARLTAAVVSVGNVPFSAPLPAGFIGLSLEYSAVPAYAGIDPAALDLVFEQLIRNLTPGQRPVLGIGGDSTDQAWWPVPGVARPGIVDYTLTPGWIRTTAALARALGAKLILGINLAINSPKLAAAEAQALLAGIGSQSIAALEIGNEPDIYRQFPAYKNSQGKLVHVRGKGYDFSDFTPQFTAVRQTLPRLPIAGPTLGGSGSSWARDLGRFIAAEPGLSLVTVHQYPLSCFASPGSPQYPTIAHLLSDYATSGLAQGVAPLLAVARAHRLALRVDELNSATCGGKVGVSDTFASALWALQTLFALDQTGVAGVNIHTFPGARYALFSTAASHGSWHAVVHPEYYGLLMFTQAAPPGSQLLPVSAVATKTVKIWATIAPDKTIRAVLINLASAPRTVLLTAPPGAGGAGAVEQLLAPSLTATTGVTLGGQTFAQNTTTGTLTGTRQTTTISPASGRYPITLPAASATMLTWTPAAATSVTPSRNANDGHGRQAQTLAPQHPLAPRRQGAADNASARGGRRRKRHVAPRDHPELDATRRRRPKVSSRARRAPVARPSRARRAPLGAPLGSNTKRNDVTAMRWASHTSREMSRTTVRGGKREGLMR
ncbi:MAG: glycosyl hydrolase family 79 C-terminal domain-containing protein [Solirubrobacteraceae bacterium]